MSDIIYVSKATLEQLKEELHRMRTVDRPAAARAIAEAREKGDLKENAEYDAAKEAQGMLEAKIAALTEENQRLRRIADAAKYFRDARRQQDRMLLRLFAAVSEAEEK